MAAEESVTGQMAVTLIDEMSSIWGIMPAPNRVILPAIGIMGLGLVVASAGFGSVIGDIRWAFVLLGIFCTAFALYLPVWCTLTYLRSSTEQRLLYVAVEAGRIEKRSGTGFAFAVPWRDLRWCRENDLGFTLGLKPLGVMYLPKRAFAASAVRSIRRLVRDKLGNAAKLREDL